MENFAKRKKLNYIDQYKAANGIIHTENTAFEHRYYPATQA